MNYSNPRMEARFDWPYRGNVRTFATFKIESKPGFGERGVRVTIDPKTGRESKPKTLTYSAKARIVDGDDGKTYIAEFAGSAGFIKIMQSNMQFQQEAIFPTDARFAGLLELFN